MSPENPHAPDRDRRRPSAWDWLLCLLTPINVIAYHHRRAGFSMTHVFCLATASCLSGLVSLGLSFAWFCEYVADYVATDKSVWKAFGGLPVEERARLLGDYINSMPKAAVLANLTRLNKFFAFSCVALAAYVVFKARVATRKAQGELGDGQTSSAHFTLSSPKGTGSGFMSYSIAVASPSVSFAINNDRRLAYFAIAFLQATLQSFVFGMCLGLLAARTVPEAAEAVSTGVIVFVVVAVAFALILPIRLAVVNFRTARRDYVKTLIIR
jgi:hypothetical protein